MYNHKSRAGEVVTIEFQLDRTAVEPVYRQITEQLKHYIREHELPPHTPLPPINQLTEAAGASMRTVDLALNQLIREGVCYRRPKKGTFVSAPETAPVRRKQLCGLYVADSAMERFTRDNFDISMYRSMTAAARSGRMDIILLSGDLEENIGFDAGRGDLAFAGIILLETDGLERVGAMALKYPEIRWVCANYRYEGFDDTPDNVVGIFNDDFGGAYRIADYYFARGCRNPAVISLELADSNYRRRIDGFRAAARDHGVILSESRVVAATPEDAVNQFDYGASRAERLLALPTPPDLLLCCNDSLALGATRYLEHANCSDRVRVTGYDNRDFNRPLNFSTVAVDFNAIGSRAFALALDPKPAVKFYTVSPELIIRGIQDDSGN